MIDATVPDAPLNYRHFRAGVLLQQADAATSYPPCMRCGVLGHFYEGERPYGTGHCYTRAGSVEFGISKHCEWCFDLIMRDPEDPDDQALLQPLRDAERMASHADNQ